LNRGLGNGDRQRDKKFKNIQNYLLTLFAVGV
jgi:hypothetical protein